MPNKRAKVETSEHSPSSKYPGMIDLGGGAFREPYLYRGKPANRYFVEKPCHVCGALTLVHASNARRSKVSVCSRACKNSYMSKPDGVTKRKTSGHVLEKLAQHPSARKGFVPQHRLVVERHMGRLLTAEERVHHINCIPNDNRIENLFVCENPAAHTRAHNSLNECVAELLELGALMFDAQTGKYRVNA